MEAKNINHLNLTSDINSARQLADRCDLDPTLITTDLKLSLQKVMRLVSPTNCEDAVNEIEDQSRTMILSFSKWKDILTKRILELPPTLNTNFSTPPRVTVRSLSPDYFDLARDLSTIIGGYPKRVPLNKFRLYERVFFRILELKYGLSEGHFQIEMPPKEQRANHYQQKLEIEQLLDCHYLSNEPLSPNEKIDKIISALLSPYEYWKQTLYYHLLMIIIRSRHTNFDEVKKNRSNSSQSTHLTLKTENYRNLKNDLCRAIGSWPISEQKEGFMKAPDRAFELLTSIVPGAEKGVGFLAVTKKTEKKRIEWERKYQAEISDRDTGELCLIECLTEKHPRTGDKKIDRRIALDHRPISETVFKDYARHLGNHKIFRKHGLFLGEIFLTNANWKELPINAINNGNERV